MVGLLPARMARTTVFVPRAGRTCGTREPQGQRRRRGEMAIAMDETGEDREEFGFTPDWRAQLPFAPVGPAVGRKRADRGGCGMDGGSVETARGAWSVRLSVGGGRRDRAAVR